MCTSPGVDGNATVSLTVLFAPKIEADSVSVQAAVGDRVSDTFPKSVIHVYVALMNFHKSICFLITSQL